MSDNEIKKYDKKIPRKEIRSKSHKIAKTIYNLKWFKAEYIIRLLFGYYLVSGIVL